IASAGDNPALDIHHIEEFLMHILERIDLSRDLHFHTNTTIDTLDYSGDGLNAGSKVVFAAAGEKKRELARELPQQLELPRPFSGAKLALPGVLVVDGATFTMYEQEAEVIDAWCTALQEKNLNG